MASTNVHRGFRLFQDPLLRLQSRNDVYIRFVEKAKVKDSSQLTQLRAMGPRQDAGGKPNSSAQQTTKSALSRVRNGGCVPPKKKSLQKK